MSCDSCAVKLAPASSSRPGSGAVDNRSTPTTRPWGAPSAGEGGRDGMEGRNGMVPSNSTTLVRGEKKREMLNSPSSAAVLQCFTTTWDQAPGEHPHSTTPSPGRSSLKRSFISSSLKALRALRGNKVRVSLSVPPGNYWLARPQGSID